MFQRCLSLFKINPAAEHNNFLKILLSSGGGTYYTISDNIFKFS